MNKPTNLYERVQEALKGFTGEIYPVVMENPKTVGAIPCAILTESEKKLYTLSCIHINKRQELLDLMWESVRSLNPVITHCEKLELRPGYGVYGCFKTYQKQPVPTHMVAPFDDSGRYLGRIV